MIPSTDQWQVNFRQWQQESIILSKCQLFKNILPSGTKTLRLFDFTYIQKNVAFLIGVLNCDSQDLCEMAKENVHLSVNDKWTLKPRSRPENSPGSSPGLSCPLCSDIHRKQCYFQKPTLWYKWLLLRATTASHSISVSFSAHIIVLIVLDEANRATRSYSAIQWLKVQLSATQDFWTSRPLTKNDS